MKTKSGNGVKVTNYEKIVSSICKANGYKRNWNESFIERIKSVDLLNFWDYKSEGLKLDQAKSLLINACNKRYLISKNKHKEFHLYSKKNRFLDMQSEKRKAIETFILFCEKLESIKKAYCYRYGNYKYSHKTFILPCTNTKYPVTLTVAWDEEHDWDFYAKSYNRPKSTYDNRRIEFKTIGKFGNKEIIFTYLLDSFAGNFIEKAIAAFYKIDKIKVSKELKSLQLQDYFSLTELKAINGYRLFNRRIGNVSWDFAILDTKTGMNFHSFNLENLVPGLRNKITAKFDIENTEINKQTGYSLGFCETGMRSFCNDNNVDFEGTYTRKELRNIVTKNREQNYRKYKTELNKIGISISK